MLVSVDLMFKYAKSSNLLYLFERLRYSAKNTGGYFDLNSLNKNERYRLLPELQRMGWVSGNRVVGYRKILNVEVSCFNYTRIVVDDLSSIKRFRALIISSCESYLLNWRYKIQKDKAKRFSQREGFSHKWVYAGAVIGCEKFNVEKFSDETFKGRLADSILAKCLDLSLRTIGGWRSCAKLNSYEKKFVYSDDPYSGMSFYNRRLRKFLTLDRVIKTSIPLFNNKFHNNYKL